MADQGRSEPSRAAPIRRFERSGQYQPNGKARRDLRSRPSFPHTWKIGPSTRFQGRGNVCDDRRFIIDELLRLPLQLADVLSTSIIHVWRCDVDSRLKPPVRSRADDRVELLAHD